MCEHVYHCQHLLGLAAFVLQNYVGVCMELIVSVDESHGCFEGSKCDIDIFLIFVPFKLCIRCTVLLW